MELLFKREQNSLPGQFISFKLFSKIEFAEDELNIVERYRLNSAILITADQPNLHRNSLIVAVFVFVIVAAVLLRSYIFSVPLTGYWIPLLAGIGAGFWYWNENRETIMVKDLIHGRHFKCNSVVELARKEAWLEFVVGYLRQVMETAKHWDGTERHEIEPLSKDQARYVAIRGI